MAEKRRSEEMDLAKARINSWSPEDCTIDFVIDELKSALGAATIAGLKVPEHAQVLPEEKLDLVRQTFEAIHDLHRYLPKVELWCAVKHNQKGNEGSMYFPPSVYVGCTTKAQAQELTKALDAREAAEWKANPHWGTKRTRFKCERAGCNIRSVVKPDVTAEEYMRRFGR